MNPRTNFWRKVLYLVAIGLLWMPLFYLSQPATSANGHVSGHVGGLLAQLREKYHLSQTQLGQIDPTSETIKLATLGLRGVAANILWAKATNYQKKKDWTNLSATLEQITKVQPHFIAVWRHQAWNLSYNVSAAFDDYHDKYHWVMRGIEFLREGVGYNENDARLRWDLGWFIGNKIGRADEKTLFRRLFKEDDDFHKSRPRGERDNWLVSKEMFRAAEVLFRENSSAKGMGPLLFFSHAPMCQMNYAENLEKDGTFGEVAAAAWSRAGNEWREYGELEMPTSWGVDVRLNDEEKDTAAAHRAVDELQRLQPGLREKIAAERRAELTAPQRKALDTPDGKRTPTQRRMVATVEPQLQVSNKDVARRIKGPQRAHAMQLADEADAHNQQADYTRRERSIVNFVYWRTRAEVEQDKQTLEARKLIFQGDEAFDRADLLVARAKYEKGLVAWRNVLDHYPQLREDRTTADDLSEVINRYRTILKHFEASLPKNFILQDMIDLRKK